MSKEGLKGRRYSDEEFALILRKASELQEGSGSPSERGVAGRFSLEEIQSIAAEAGIDAGAVARAASLLNAQEWEEKRRLARVFFGESSNVHLDLEVPGRVPPQEMGRILEAVRRVMEHQGEVTTVLGGMEWKTVGQPSAVNVNVSPRGEETSIQIVGDRSAAGAMTFVFPMMGSAILIGALGAAFEPQSVMGIVSLVSGLLGGGFLVSRTLWARGSRRFRRKLARLMEALVHSVEKVAEPGPASPPPDDAS